MPVFGASGPGLNQTLHYVTVQHHRMDTQVAVGPVQMSLLLHSPTAS